MRPVFFCRRMGLIKSFLENFGILLYDKNDMMILLCKD